MLQSLLQAFATVFPAELPDKTMIATIVLVTRFRRPLWVWVGAVSAFTVHVIVAVAAGRAISLLPEAVVGAVVATLFAVGAVLLFRAARSAPDADELAEAATSAPASSTIRATVLGSFGLIVLAEWGDLTQLATASLAASSDSALGTAIGAWLALAAVAGIAAAFGRQLVERVPIQRVNYIGAAVFAALAVWTLVDLLR
jgi:putative Ca2+/H+ antiporter (TMEM165/GDT1 family)